jgi:hypothetical protein
MKPIFIALSLFCLPLLCISCGKNADDVPINAVDVDMEKMRWKISDFPIQLKMSNNLDLQYQSQVNSVLDEWERSANIDFFDPAETTANLNFSKMSDYYYKDKHVNGIYLARNKVAELVPGVLAVTQIYFETLRDSNSKLYYHILETDIVLNGYDYTFSTDSLDHSTFYFYYVILHEVGHVLGLGHNKTGVMNPFASTDDKTETLTNTETDLLNIKYNITNALTNEAKPLLNNMAMSSDIIRIVIPLTEATFLANNFIKMNLTKERIIRRH